MTKTPFDSLYDCTMTVTGFNSQKEQGITKQVEIVLLQDIPCRISQMGNRSTTGADYQANGYDMKLFCNLDTELPAGCKITVTDRNGHVRVFKQSNVPINQYLYHQEIAVKLEGKS